MAKVLLKKFKNKNRVASFVVTVTDEKLRWQGDFYLTIDEAGLLFKLLKKELKLK